MNRLFLIVSLFFILTVPQMVQAAVKSPYPNPYRQTMWNNITDSMHTAGQDPQQAKATLRTLHTRRNKARLKSINEANRAKRNAKRRAWVNN